MKGLKDVKFIVTIAEIAYNRDDLSDSQLQEGIIYTSNIVSTNLNDMYYKITQAIQYMQFTGGLYNEKVPYNEGNIVTVIRNVEGVYQLWNFIRNGDNADREINNPPVKNATFENKNGVIVFVNGDLNPDWTVVSVPKDTFNNIVTELQSSIDQVQTNLTNHENTTIEGIHGSAVIAAPHTLLHRDVNGYGFVQFPSNYTTAPDTSILNKKSLASGLGALSNNYTYVVDSVEKLNIMHLASQDGNLRGYNFTRILVKNAFGLFLHVDISSLTPSDTGHVLLIDGQKLKCSTLVGENGATIKIRTISAINVEVSAIANINNISSINIELDNLGSNGKYQNALYLCNYIDNCYILHNFEGTGTGMASCFYNCQYITNSSTHINSFGSGTRSASGFLGCQNIINCYSIASSIDTGIASGFRSCDYISNSRAATTADDSAVGNIAYSASFHTCRFVSNCSANSDSLKGAASWGFYNCQMVSNSEGIASARKTGFAGSFYRTNYISNCKAQSKAVYTAYGFIQCTSINTCLADIGIGNTLSESAYGFFGCDSISNSIGIGSASTTACGFHNCWLVSSCYGCGTCEDVPLSTGYAFRQCATVSYCRTSAINTTGVFYDCYASAKINATFVCAMTANGGFNDPTNQ